MAHLCLDMGLPVLITAPLGLGAINHTLLTEHYARRLGLVVAGIVLNSPARAEGNVAEQTNPEVLQALCQAPLLGCLPWIEDLAASGPTDLADAADRHLRWRDPLPVCLRVVHPGLLE